MFLNVWLIIWPNQKIMIASNQQIKGGGQALPEAAAAAPKAGLASRTNVLFSIPMLFFMGASAHFAHGGLTADKQLALIVALVIIAALELNAIFGKQGPLVTVRGVIVSGLALTVVLVGRRSTAVTTSHFPHRASRSVAKPYSASAAVAKLRRKSHRIPRCPSRARTRPPRFPPIRTRTGYRRPGGRVRDDGGRSGLGSNLLFAVLLGGLAAAGWFITTQHQQLVKAETALTQADHRLAVLEERLQVTDQVMSESGTEVQSKLGQWETEIKKLWDASKRDKQMITDDQTKLKEHDGSIEGMQTAIKDLKSSDTRQEQALAQQTAIAQQLASVDQQVKQLVAQQRQLTDQVNAARQSVSGIETGLTNAS